MNKVELALMIFCIMGCVVTLETTDAKTEQTNQAEAPTSARQRRILTNIKSATGSPVERRLMNPYLMSSVYNSMMLNYMGLGMSPYSYSPYSMYHMGGMMNPMYSMGMMNPMMMGMMNPMMMGMMNPMMMGMMNPMMHPMSSMMPWMMMNTLHQNNNVDNGSKKKSGESERILNISDLSVSETQQSK